MNPATGAGLGKERHASDPIHRPDGPPRRLGGAGGRRRRLALHPAQGRRAHRRADVGRPGRRDGGGLARRSRRCGPRGRACAAPGAARRGCLPHRALRRRGRLRPRRQAHGLVRARPRADQRRARTPRRGNRALRAQAAAARRSHQGGRQRRPRGGAVGRGLARPGGKAPLGHAHLRRAPGGARLRVREPDASRAARVRARAGNPQPNGIRAVIRGA